MVTRDGIAGRVGRVYFGWWIVIAGIIFQGLSGLLFMHSAGAYFVLLRDQFQWSGTVLSGAFSLSRIESGILGPLQGWLLDKVGPRAVARIGILFFALGFVFMSRMDSVLEFYGSFALMALGSGLAGFLTLTTTIVNWFERRRALAVGLAHRRHGPGRPGRAGDRVGADDIRVAGRRALLRHRHRAGGLPADPALPPHAGGVRLPARRRSAAVAAGPCGADGAPAVVPGGRARLHRPGGDADPGVLAHLPGPRLGPAGRLGDDGPPDPPPGAEPGLLRGGGGGRGGGAQRDDDHIPGDGRLRGGPVQQAGGCGRLHAGAQHSAAHPGQRHGRGHGLSGRGATRHGVGAARARR